jgi:hypothetical protein
MSETAPEPTVRPPAAGGNFLTRKYGPLPGWGWGALGALGAGGYYLWRKHQASTAPATTATDTSTTDTAPDISAIQSEVQQLQGAASTGSAQDVTQNKDIAAEKSAETKTAAQLAAERKRDTSEAKQLDAAQRRIAALQKQERREHPGRRPRQPRSPAVHGGGGERRRKK